MALSDFEIFSEQVQTVSTEIVAQQIDKFNQASRGSIILRTAEHMGDFADNAYYGLLQGIVRSRNVYGNGTVNEKALRQILDTMVKVAKGTPPIRTDAAWWRWMAQDPSVAGAIIGQQLAPAMMQDFLNTGINCAVAALSGNSGIIFDETGTSDSNKKMTVVAQNKAAQKFGDQSSNIVAWVLHSTPMHDFWDASARGTNGNSFLFQYGTLNVMSDPFGRIYIVTDAPGLVNDDDGYFTLGLAPGAIRIDRNDDFEDNVDNRNGFENIRKTYQAEWSFNIGINGYTWDKASGGASPSDAALAMSSNWDVIATDNKNTAGVLLITN